MGGYGGILQLLRASGLAPSGDFWGLAWNLCLVKLSLQAKPSSPKTPKTEDPRSPKKAKPITVRKTNSILHTEKSYSLMRVKGSRV